VVGRELPNLRPNVGEDHRGVMAGVESTTPGPHATGEVGRMDGGMIGIFWRSGTVRMMML